jgi:outer membrane murein-binding lipoprotein Lpp
MKLFPTRSSNSKRRQLGLSLTEAAFWLLLAAGAVAVAVIAYRSNNQQARITAVATDLRKVAAKIDQLYPTGVDFAALGAVNAANCGVPAQNQVFTGTQFQVVAGAGGAAPTVNHPFDGGAVNCGAAQLVVANDGFRINLVGLTDEVCAEIVQNFKGGARRILVDAVAVQALNAPLNPATLGAQCTAAAAANAHTVSFDFGRN